VRSCAARSPAAEGAETGAEPGGRRLGSLPLPSYAYRPGRTPHPRRDPRGHSFGRPEPEVARFPPSAWAEQEPWLHGLDLFHAGYFWEAHEVFEAYTRVFGAGAEGRLLRALVQLAAAELKRADGGPAASRLADRAVRGLEGLPAVVLGVRTRALATRVTALRAAGSGTPAPIEGIEIPLDEGPDLVHTGN
jgi:predicted metal-dependent hydrolase